MSGDELVDGDTERDREAVDRLETERVTSAALLNAAHLAGADTREPLELALPNVPLDRHLDEKQITKLLAVLEPKRAAVCAYIFVTAADWRCVDDAKPADFGEHMVLVRGTKNERRWRTVPVLPPLRAMYKLARKHVPFEKWGNVRRDLAVACRRAGVPVITPRDLRRSHSKFLRARGVDPQLISPMLGHADSRMVERVYGRIAPEALAKQIADRIGTKSVQVPARHRVAKRKTAKKKAA